MEEETIGEEATGPVGIEGATSREDVASVEVAEITTFEVSLEVTLPVVGAAAPRFVALEFEFEFFKASEGVETMGGRVLLVVFGELEETVLLTDRASLAVERAEVVLAGKVALEARFVQDVLSGR